MAECNERRYVRRVSMGKNPWDEVREAVQDVEPMDAGVGRQAAVADEAFNRGSQGPTSQTWVEPMEWP